MEKNSFLNQFSSFSNEIETSDSKVSLKDKVTELVELEWHLNKAFYDNYVDSLSKNKDFKENVTDMDKYIEITKKFFGNKKMEKEMKEKTIEILMNIYTEKEVNLLLKFMKNPEFKSIQDKKAIIVKQTLSEMAKITEKYKDEYILDLTLEGVMKAPKVRF